MQRSNRSAARTSRAVTPVVRGQMARAEQTSGRDMALSELNWRSRIPCPPRTGP